MTNYKIIIEYKFPLIFTDLPQYTTQLITMEVTSSGPDLSIGDIGLGVRAT